MKNVILGIVILSLMVTACFGTACDKPEPVTEACAPIAAACEPIGEITPQACAPVYTGQVCFSQYASPVYAEPVYAGKVYTYEYTQTFAQPVTVPVYQGVPVRVRTPIIRRNFAPNKTEITIKRERTPRF